MSTALPAPTKPPILGVRALQAVVAILLLMRLGFMLAVAPIGDEAYYWTWGQHPDLSYFDHPPLNAWLLGLASHIFGWNVVGLRILEVLTTGGTIWIFRLWSRRQRGDQRHSFWVATAAYLATPIIAIFAGIMFPDHLLIFLSIATIYAFNRFFETWELSRPAWRHLFLGAVALGLAMLTKYSAIFVAVAVVLHIALVPKRWRLLLEWRLWLAGLVSLAVFSPVLVWNLQHDWASFRFHLSDHSTTLLDNLQLPKFGFWVLFAVLYIGPFLLAPLVRLVFTWDRAAGVDIARLTFLASSAFFGLMGAGIGALPYWNIVAYAALFPWIAVYLGARLQLIAHIAYGVLAFGAVIANYAVTPLVYVFGGSDWESSVVYGWDEIDARFAAAEAAQHPDFLAATRYTLAAQLSFARGRDDVTALSSRHDQYDLWFDPAAHVGQSALILGDTTYGIDSETAASFAAVSEVGRFDVIRFGKVVNTYVLYAADGFGEGTAGVPPAPR
jgi:4-amino-4-deoxy-L-arabinose transferase-like glycosyltransferase